MHKEETAHKKYYFVGLYSRIINFASACNLKKIFKNGRSFRCGKIYLFLSSYLNQAMVKMGQNWSSFWSWLPIILTILFPRLRGLRNYGISIELPPTTKKNLRLFHSLCLAKRLNFSLTFSQRRIISLPPATVLEHLHNLHITKSDIAFLSYTGSDTTGVSGVVKRPLTSLSRKTWKHKRTEFKSILAGWKRWSNPAEIIFI